MGLTRRQWVGLAGSTMIGGSLAAQERTGSTRQLSEPVHRVANARLEPSPAASTANPGIHPLDRALQMA
ncbi:MAG: hypothetical protein AAF664_09350, partial [Planctomycetota bacterium]